MAAFFAKKQPGAASKPKGKKVFAWATYLFVLLMLLYPVGHFLITWIGVNFNSLLLVFQKSDRTGKLYWVMQDWNHDFGSFFPTLFSNFTQLFESFQDKTQNTIYQNSLVYLVISCFVTLPISLFFSYFVFKKIWGSTFYKIIFFIPSIFPLFILCMVYAYSLAPEGLFAGILNWMKIDPGNFFVNLKIDNTSRQWFVWIFMVWSGIGYDVILLTAGMSRIPREILESCKMDGVNPFREFFRIIVPLCWPTITTLFVFGMMSVFSVAFQPFFLTGDATDIYTKTIGEYIYFTSKGGNYTDVATLGLFCSLIGAPIICATRWGLNKAFANVGF